MIKKYLTFYYGLHRANSVTLTIILASTIPLYHSSQPYFYYEKCYSRSSMEVEVVDYDQRQTFNEFYHIVSLYSEY